jgi:DNA-binding SARP family transcriptional activator
MTPSAPDNQSEHPEYAPAEALFITLLGECSVWLGRRLIPAAAFPRRKALSLLKLIALQSGHQLHRDQALDILWPELTPDSASTQLYKAIHHARQAFASVMPATPPDALLQLHGDIIRLAAPGGVATDVAEFESLASQSLKSRDLEELRQAVNRYRGDLLPGDAYESWVTRRRDTLREQFLDLLVELGSACLAGGALAEAADALRQAIARDATCESAHRELMLVYARQGSRVRALRQYQACEEALRSELGAGVSANTAALYQDILHERIAQAPLSAKRVSVNFTALPPLIGRRAELDVIQTLVMRLAQGQGSVLGLEGDAGMGKSRLAREIVRLGWQRRWHVLFGAATENEGHEPYMPFVEALRAALWSDPSGSSLIPVELAIAIPEIPSGATVRVLDGPTDQRALFAGVVRFLEARARSAPVLLVLDDLHAFDRGSLKLFAYLAREAASLPLLLVGGWRPHEPDSAPALAEMIAGLERRKILRLLRLAPLSADEQSALVVQALGGGELDARLRDELYRFTEGNALFAEEMARQLATDGGIARTEGVWRFATESSATKSSATDTTTAPAIPQSVRALAQRRLASLSSPAARLTQLAATIGRDAPLPVLEHGTEAQHAGDALLGLLDEIVAAGLLTEVGLDFRFPHPLLRDAVYGQISLPRRMKLHGEVAAALEALSADDNQPAPVEAIAYHYRLAGDTSRAIRYLLQAGSRAEAVYDHDGALARYEEVLALLPNDATRADGPTRSELYERIGDTRRTTGDVRRSLEAYLQALNALPSAQSLSELARSFTLRCKVALDATVTLDMPLAAEHLAQARTLLGPEPLSGARLLIAEALFAWYSLDFDTALQRATQALAIARQEHADVETNQALELLALSHFPLGHWEEGLNCELQRRVTGWSPDVVVAMDAHLCLFQYAFSGAESSRLARQYFEAIAQQALVVGNQRCLAVAHFALGSLAFAHGQPDVAADRLDQALKLHERIGSSAGVAYTLAQQLKLLTAAGLYESAPSLVERAADAALQSAMRDHSLSQIFTAGLHNRLAAGDAKGAEALAEAASAHIEHSPPCAVCRVDLFEALATFALQRSAFDEARSHIEQGQRIAGYARNLSGQARLTRMAGLLEAAHGETARARQRLDEAADHFRMGENQYELGLTLQAIAKLSAGFDSAQLRNQSDTLLAPYRASALAARLLNG